jgi:transcriptional regulator with XRE-family HTH domain
MALLFSRMSSLKALRERAHLSQAMLAEKARVGRTTLAKIEAGRANPQPETRRRLADALGVDLMKIRFDTTRAVQSKSSPQSESGQTADVGGNGNVERLADGSLRIWLDEYMPEEAQVVLFGDHVPTLTVPPHTVFRPPNGALNVLHVHALDTDALRVLAFEAEDPPTLYRCTRHGVILRSWWIDAWGDEEHFSLVFVPWDRVLGASVRQHAKIEDTAQAASRGDRNGDEQP